MLAQSRGVVQIKRFFCLVRMKCPDMLIPLTPVTRKKMFKAMVSESASLVLYRNHHGQKLAHVQSIHSTGVNGISICPDYCVSAVFSPARRSLTTAEAAISPATEGTKEMVPGISFRVEHFRMLLPLGQMHDWLQLASSTSKASMTGSLE